MDDTRNLLVAIVLSMAVLFLWQAFYVLPIQREAARIAGEREEDGIVTDALTPEFSTSTTETSSTPEIILKSREEVIASSNKEVGRIAIESNSLHGSLSLKNGRIDDITLIGYHQQLDKTSPEVILLSPSETENVYFAEFGWLAKKGVSVPGKDTIWQANKNILRPNDPVILTWNNGEGLKFKKTITLDDNYMFTIEQSVQNNTTNEVLLHPYGLINRSKPDERVMYISHEGPLGVYGKKLEELGYDDLQDDGSKEYESSKGWIGIADKYWLTALIPEQGKNFQAKAKYYSKNGQHRYQVDYTGKPILLAAGENATTVNHIFVGAKKVDLLDKYREELNIPLFDRAIDYGSLYFLTRPMFAILQYSYSFLGNFGLAILLLTVAIKTMLFPLANKSFRSMAQMRLVMPEMKELRERYEDDKAKLNQEMMKFYKERKINPMAGCLPILIQIPIFFSLYKVLFVTIEMRHAPFYGWIKDLAAPDPTNILQLFGLINWTPPEILPAIGVLPCLFCITMMMQQRLNPPPTDPTQAMIIKWLPVLFLFMFASFPAGLVVYWVWSNILSILQQYIITQKINKDMPGHNKKADAGSK